MCVSMCECVHVLCLGQVIESGESPLSIVSKMQAAGNEYEH